MKKKTPSCAVSMCSFIDDAYDDGIPVVILTAYSKSGETIARYTLLLANFLLCKKLKKDYTGIITNIFAFLL